LFCTIVEQIGEAESVQNEYDCVGLILKVSNRAVDDFITIL